MKLKTIITVYVVSFALLYMGIVTWLAVDKHQKMWSARDHCEILMKTVEMQNKELKKLKGIE